MLFAGFGIRQPVPANLLALVLVLGGVLAGLLMRRDFFPAIPARMAAITLVWPGADPEQVEQTLAAKIEEVLIGLDEVEEVTATLSEGGGGVVVEFKEGEDPDEALREIERAIDSLRDWPADAEKPAVELIEARMPAIRLAMYGDLSEKELKETALRVRDELRMIPGMGLVQVDGVRQNQICIDVDQGALISTGLSLVRVSEAVRSWLSDVPGGSVQGEDQTARLRVTGVEEDPAPMRMIPIKSLPGGRVIRLGDVAEVRRSFDPTGLLTRFNGKPASFLMVYSKGDQDVVRMAEIARSFSDGYNGVALELSMLEKMGVHKHRQQGHALGLRMRHQLSEDLSVEPLSNIASYLEGRIDLLTRNGLQGIMLVFLCLLIFLSLRAAFWVMVGLTVAMGGTLLGMWLTGQTLNFLSMFGMIMAIGMLVDDGIVVAENIETEKARQHDSHNTKAADRATRAVFWPVVCTVSTSIIAFMPLKMIKGEMGDFLGSLPWVVSIALAFSLIESLAILPGHMAHGKSEHTGKNWLDHFYRIRDGWVDRFFMRPHARVVEKVVHYRYITIAAALSVLMVSVSMVRSGRIGFEFFPVDDSETIMASIGLPVGSPLSSTDKITRDLEKAALEIPEVKSVSAVVGASTDVQTGRGEASAEHKAQVFVELKPVEERDRTSHQIMDDIRAALGDATAGVERFRMDSVTGGPSGPGIQIRLRSASSQSLRQASSDLRHLLLSDSDIVNVDDTFRPGHPEMRIMPRTDLESAGLSQSDLALHMAGYGAGIKAWNYADGNEDIDVRVRLAQRGEGQGEVMQAWIVNRHGTAVPLREVAEVEVESGWAVINRVNGQRSVTVMAEMRAGASAEEIITRLEDREDGLHEFRLSHSNVVTEKFGQQRNLQRAMNSLPLGFAAALMGIYVILAWLFRSYTQPFVVMLVIPFAAIGAIWGHKILGIRLAFMSILGFVALMGIVVNDSLVLVSFYNRLRQQGKTVHDALVQASHARLRAIFLTTVTTAAGLLPITLERSFQAKFLIPMAVTISAGLIGATMIVLLVLPALLRVLDDIHRLAYFLWNGRAK